MQNRWSERLSPHEPPEGCRHRCDALSRTAATQNRVRTQSFYSLWAIFSTVKKAKFAVCFIVWFELHARWLDWCQIGSRKPQWGFFWGNPCFGDCVGLGERAGAVVSAEGGDLTDGGIQNARDIGMV